MEPTRPLLVLNPGDDRTFADLAEQLVSDGRLTTDELQAALRELFPATVVRPRELSHEVETVWYVYREGRWVPTGEARRDAGDVPDRRPARARRARSGRGHPAGRGARRGGRGPAGRGRDVGSGASKRAR